MANAKIPLLILFLLFIIAGCSTSSHNDELSDNDQTVIVEARELTSVVATVNGEDITLEEVMALQDRYIQLELTESAALEQLIEHKLVLGKANEAGFSATDREAQTVIEDQLESLGLSLEEYTALLEAEGYSYTDELKNIKEQLAIQKLFDQEIPETEITEGEARDFYEMYKAQVQDAPSYEEFKPHILVSLKQLKRQEAIEIIIQELKQEADISYS
jgi:parvulin-like peptidyl-prolyl isomerase